jgi:hypothetical protein
MNLHHPVAGVVLAAVLAFGVAPAYGASTQRDSFGFGFTTLKPGAAAGVQLSVKFAGPRQVDRLTFLLPMGTRTNASAVEQCTGTDPAACPAGSRIGTGRADFTDSGSVDHLDLVAYATESGALLDFQRSGRTTFTAGVVFSGRSARIDLGASVRDSVYLAEFGLQLDNAGTASRPLIRTPARCPSGGRWRGAVIAQQGISRRTTRARTRCSRR